MGFCAYADYAESKPHHSLMGLALDYTAEFCDSIEREFSTELERLTTIP